MKPILTIISAILIFSCCLNGTNHNKGKRELIPYPEKYEYDGYLELPDSLKPIFTPDTIIGKYCLLNSEKVDEIMERIRGEGMQNTGILSSDKKQIFTLYFHPNGVKEFTEFKVKYNNRQEQNHLVLITGKEFITESKIKLGITIGELRAIKGEPDSISKNGTITFCYRISDFENSDFLKKYNSQLYYSDYKFTNGYLTEFQFGFKYQ